MIRPPLSPPSHIRGQLRLDHSPQLIGQHPSARHAKIITDIGGLFGRHALGRLPSREWAINQVWVQITAIAADLTAWLQHLALTGDLAKAEPKTLRFRMLHVPARLIRGGRGRRLRIPAHWPWAAQIAEAFRRTMIIPAPT